MMMMMWKDGVSDHEKIIRSKKSIQNLEQTISKTSSICFYMSLEGGLKENQKRLQL